MFHKQKNVFLNYAVTSLFVIVVFWLLFGSKSRQNQQPEKYTLPPVTVVRAIPINRQIKVSVTGITTAQWLTDITASVNGRVIEIISDSQPGSLIEKGKILVKLLNTSYQSELELTKAHISEAKLKIEEIKNKQYVIKKMGKVKSSYGRLDPHLKVAKVNLSAAQATMKTAKQQLIDTQITAPFPAIIISEHVSPGQWVNSMDVLFKIASSQSIDIKVELSSDTWKTLKNISKDQPASIISASDHKWLAKVRYLSPIMDPITRQRGLMLEVLNPYNDIHPLLADQQVKVIFPGTIQSNVINAPASVLTQDGKVWSIINNTLQLESIKLLDEHPEYILYQYIKEPQKPRYLVRFPLSSMLDGQKVSINLDSSRHIL